MSRSSALNASVTRAHSAIPSQRQSRVNSHRHAFSALGFDKSFATYTTKNYAAKALRGTWSSIG
ncbi:MAG: hypothetical protein EBQ63_02445 [Actinobacteria bacterium]|nr:hypothetical protein [Actinomycetota bacterium]NDF11174.1 hypothetical protein [Actinomycetota bacterium]